MAPNLAFVFAVLACLTLFCNVDALWRLQCDGIAAIAPMDPIISPGETSSHVHTIKGSSGMCPSSLLSVRLFSPYI